VEETKQGLLATGFQLTWAAFRHERDLSHVSLKGFAYPVPGGAKPTLSLFTTVSAQQARAARQTDNFAAIQRYFTSPWWHPCLAKVTI